ncbi:hypothetical protein D3C87_2151880 [compost metagenome]
MLVVQRKGLVPNLLVQNLFLEPLNATLAVSFDVLEAFDLYEFDLHLTLRVLLSLLQIGYWRSGMRQRRCRKLQKMR